MPLTTDGRKAEAGILGNHAYPSDLARIVCSRWPAAVAGEGVAGFPLPPLKLLERLLSICYQASLLREEGRSITFRLALSGPEVFRAESGPPGGLHRLLFSRPRPLDEQELRGLAPAAPFHHSLIGVRLDDDDLEIWGLIHSGQRWLQSVRGGRGTQQIIPPVLMVAVTGPGRILVSRGTETVAALAAGVHDGPGMDLLSAPWMLDVFAGLRKAQSSAHLAARQQSARAWANVDSQFGPLLAQHVLRRMLATIRGAQKGGTVILLPARSASDVLASGRHLDLKYAFHDEEPRRRISTLTVDIINELARIHGPSTDDVAVHWSEYEESSAPRLAALDEALFEVAHLVAALADVDGAVVMTSDLELLGFGGEIAGHLPEVASVLRAMDLEGTEREWERTDRVGTRHRSAYRLCHAVRDAIVVVISQDGGLRFVRWHGDAVTYWDQIATGPWEI